MITVETTVDRDETLERFIQIMHEVRFPNFVYGLKRTKRGEYFLIGKYWEADTVSGKNEIQYTRKWVLTPEMTKSEVVQTAFKCILTSMEHRTREWFTYRGKAIFGSHYDVDKLYEIAGDESNFDGRKS